MPSRLRAHARASASSCATGCCESGCWSSPIGDSAWTAFFVAVPVLVVARFGADARVAGWLVASFGIGALIGNGISLIASWPTAPGASR